MFEIAEGRVLAGKYALERQLARGGMGVVWVVRHLSLDVAMAAKFMSVSPTESSTGRRRFEREAQAAARLGGPHVVHVHDYGVEQDTPYLVMELLHGEDLGARLRKVARLPPVAVSEILAQASRALRRAHDAGIVHRDLKPGNVFLARNDDTEIVKLLDFGIAKATKPSATDEVTQSDQILGSTHYMSPEQLRASASVDPRSDLWALAALAYRALTGEHPFPGDNVYSAILSICNDPVLPPSRCVPGLSQRIDRFFERALAKNPAARFQTAPELAAAFAEAAAVRSADRLTTSWEPETIDEKGPSSDTASGEVLTTDSVPLYARSVRAEIDREVTASKRGRLAQSIVPLAIGAIVASGVAWRALVTTSRAQPSPSAAAATGIAAVEAPANDAPAKAPIESPPSEAAPAPTASAPTASAPTVSAPTVSAPTVSASAAPAPPIVKPRQAMLPASPAASVKHTASDHACEPPFVIDGAGHRHIKPACL